MSTKMIKLGGLWRNVDREGNEYFSGNLNTSSRLMIFRNGYKKAEKEPDFILYIAPVEKREVEKSNAKSDPSDFGDLPF